MRVSHENETMVDERIPHSHSVAPSISGTQLWIRHATQGIRKITLTLLVAHTFLPSFGQSSVMVVLTYPSTTSLSHAHAHTLERLCRPCHHCTTNTFVPNTPPNLLAHRCTVCTHLRCPLPPRLSTDLIGTAWIRRCNSICSYDTSAIGIECHVRGRRGGR
jgi:hypothetical protein